ncbi:MAG: multifunctional CCA tRNA nucleotidyl transferase/2'3'-cyclic phosphodiesterase/2'nucleotidase/phosphatase [Stutzerimonas stutzeri]|nr:MAG: multifunctional CCA tRNA nucleotidyl transferase/2'3'-cyclic phosphodiesterase/2'nucleotidase/phosphatase [Stutzerimonas stutzeri]
MNTYLVGGAVRDLLMGREPSDRDYVVTDATPEQMLQLGFTQVGADFPVFIHPQSGDEYALARTERKTGLGYNGFSTEYAGVTLYDDLSRRDLTCNAIAIDPVNSDVIDPFGGGRDIRDKVLRHVSGAFREDPVRVLRVARLASKLGFVIAPETATLCREMVSAGELDHLTPERVRQELIKTLCQKNPTRFFDALDEVGALEKLFPEVHALKGQTQPVEHHAEGDAYVHTMMVLDAVYGLSKNDAIAGTLTGARDANVDLPLNAFAALCHDLGKGLTPKELLPKHHGHEEAGLPVTQALCRRLKMPSEYERTALKATRFHNHVHLSRVMTPKSFARIFEAMGSHTQLADIEIVARVGFADEIGRICDRKEPYQEHLRFLSTMSAVSKVRIRDAFSPDQIKAMNPEKIKNALQQLRATAAARALEEFASKNHERARAAAPQQNFERG